MASCSTQTLFKASTWLAFSVNQILEAGPVLHLYDLMKALPVKGMNEVHVF